MNAAVATLTDKDKTVADLADSNDAIYEFFKE